MEAHILGPNGVSALVEMAPVPDNPGQFQAAWSAPKTGAYLTEVTAQRGGKELGRDVLTFHRMDGVAENFHTEQNRDLLERLATQTGGQYWKPADLAKLPASIPFSQAGVTMRETKDLWDLPLRCSWSCCCCASTSGGCGGRGASFEQLRSLLWYLVIERSVPRMNTTTKQDQKNQRQKTREKRPKKQGQNSVLHDNRKQQDHEHP